MINGAIDFFLNSSLRWGIEMLVSGDGIGEHLSSFNPPGGKYVALDVNDYAVECDWPTYRRFATPKPSLCVFQER
jgi:hypothetical protein